MLCSLSILYTHGGGQLEYVFIFIEKGTKPSRALTRISSGVCVWGGGGEGGDAISERVYM